MNKSFKIFATLVLVIFTGSFLASLGLKKYRAVKMSSDLTQSPTQQATKTIDNDRIFYEAVGASPKATPAPVKRQTTRFTIELARFNNQEEAEALLMKLKERGIEGFYTPMRGSGTVIYKVRLGMFANPDDAQKVLAKVNSSANVKGVVSRLQ